MNCFVFGTWPPVAYEREGPESSQNFWEGRSEAKVEKTK